MQNFKHLRRALVCLLCCVACLICVNPVSAFSSWSNPGAISVIPELPAVNLELPVTDGHLVSYVRYGASYSSAIIGCMEDGAELTVLSTKGSFYKIDCYDMTGYIAKSQVKQKDDGTYVVCADTGSSETKRLGSFSAQEAMELKGQIVSLSKKYQGVPYVYGGTTPKGFDCSGFTQYVFREAGISINRTAKTQLQNTVIISKEDLQPGDLVIFSNTGSDGGFASHTSIYIGNGKIIHASSTKGIVIADLNASYFVQHYQCARRVILSDVSLAASVPTVDTIAGSIGSGWRNEG